MPPAILLASFHQGGESIRRDSRHFARPTSLRPALALSRRRPTSKGASTRLALRRLLPSCGLAAASTIISIALIAGSPEPTRAGIEPVGPGIAGQVHALTADPTNPDILYAGGDNCGVYRSENRGVDWQRWNAGLEDTDPRWTSYVDDLCVVPTWDGAPAGAAGVYAATRGGVAYRPAGGIWDVQTTAWTYRSGYAADVGAAVPFASLGFDSARKLLFAGTGNGRLYLPDAPDPLDFYPDAGAKQHSLFVKDLDPVGTWQPVADLTGKGPVYQIAIVHSPSGNSRAVVVTNQGVFLEGIDADPWTVIFDEATMISQLSSKLSSRFAGVAVGKRGRLYVVAQRETTHDRDPGVYVLEPVLDANDHWDYAGQDWTEVIEATGVPDARVQPQQFATWREITQADNYGPDLVTITVNPGDESTTADDDEVFVGMVPGHIQNPDCTLWYNGYFRFGPCPDGYNRWTNYLFLAGCEVWDAPDRGLGYALWDDDAGRHVKAGVTTDPGWLGGYTVGSTVPLLCWDGPDADTLVDRLFVSMYHQPMAFDDGGLGAEWSQRYTTYHSGPLGYEGYYDSNGLNIMSARAIGFRENGQLVVGCGDFVGFIATDSYGNGFKHMNPYRGMGKDCRDLEVVGDDVYMVRPSPIEWGGFHGFAADETLDPAVCYQRYVVARYDDTAAYDWEFLSTELDDDPNFDEKYYEVVDIAFADANTMFAAIKTDEKNSFIYRLHRASSESAWQWTFWWDETHNSQQGGSDWAWSDVIRHLAVVPGSERLLVLTTAEQTVFELSTVTPSDGYVEPSQVLLARSWADPQTDGRMHRSLKNTRFLQVDPYGEWVYVVTTGQLAWGRYNGGAGDHGYKEHCTNVIAARLPWGDDALTRDDWNMLLNPESGVDAIDYPGIDHAYWPDDLPQDVRLANENLPIIKDLAIHPDNPRRLFVGVYTAGFMAKENFHPNNGLWQYVPSATGQEWTQISPGALTSEPSKGIGCLGLVPGDPSTLIAGSAGQEVFVIDGLTGPPAIATGSAVLEPIHDGQRLLLLHLTQDAGMPEIVAARVDASAWGLGTRLDLVDDGDLENEGDWLAGDGIWTVDLDAAFDGLPVGTQSLTVTARDADWNMYQAEVAAEVLAEAPAQFFRNVSAATNAEFPGQPAGVAALEINATQNPADEGRDVYISALDDGVGIDDEGSLLLRNGFNGDVPQFANVSDFRFANDRPAADHGPATAACLNGDALPDLIVPAGSSGEGVLLFRQDETNFARRDGWLGGLSADLQANTWTAACGDFNGDGQLDIYLGRATPDPATGLPGPGSDALADVLLLSDMAENRVFVDATAELEIPSGAGGPIHLATSAASWCDYDRDGDLDLAVADGGTQRGVFIYENDPDIGDERFSLIVPTDPVNAPWGQNVADIVWTDVDGDGWRDVVAVTVGGQLPATAIHVLYNDPMELYGRFKPPVLLYSVPDAHRCHGLRAVDHDLDGDEDLLLLTDQAHGTPLLLLNDGGTMTAAPSGTGLAALIGPANGALVTDMDQDGDAELFLGRAEATAAFFCLAETEAASTHWLGLDLLDQRVTDAGVVDVPAVGATVVVDLGGGDAIAYGVEADGRTDPTVRFGVLAETAPSCTVTWPSGHQVTYSDLALDAVNTLRPPTAVGLVADSVRGFTEVKPDEVADWVFRWTTTYQEDRGLTRIVLDTDDPDACAVAASELKPGDANVRYQQWSGHANGALVFYHELRWLDRPCRRCSIDFTLESGRADDTGSVIETSDTETLSSRLCTSLNPNDPPGGE